MKWRILSHGLWSVREHFDMNMDEAKNMDFFRFGYRSASSDKYILNMKLALKKK